MTASVPQIPKIVHFKLGSTPTDFSEDVTAVRVVVEPGAVQKVVTLDGVTHQDAEPEAYSLDITAVQDWDSTRPGLAYYLWLHKGEKVPFEFNAHPAGTATGSTTKPPFAGTVLCVPLSYGGEANVYSESTVSLPIDGTPVLDITP
jgi:hypothetical protein